MPFTVPMPKMASATPPRMIHQVISSKRASRKLPAWIFRTMLMVMPVMICTQPRAMEPSMMATVSFSGVKRAGSSSVLSGSMILAIWGMKSPRKPPVMAPTMVVLMPHQKTSSMKFRVPSRGLDFLST